MPGVISGTMEDKNNLLSALRELKRGDGLE